MRGVGAGPSSGPDRETRRGELGLLRPGAAHPRLCVYRLLLNFCRTRSRWCLRPQSLKLLTLWAWGDEVCDPSPRAPSPGRDYGPPALPSVGIQEWGSATISVSISSADVHLLRRVQGVSRPSGSRSLQDSVSR